jgi:hypothetical protein
MRFSKLAEIYDRILHAGSEAKRISILADLFSSLDQKRLRAAVHLTAGEVIDPQLSDRLGIGPGTIRTAKETGDLSEVAAELMDGADNLAVDKLWQLANRTYDKRYRSYCIPRQTRGQESGTRRPLPLSPLPVYERA